MYICTKGVTSRIIEVMARDSETGLGKTGLAHTDITASYCRQGGTRVAIELIAGVPGAEYAAGKWAEVDAVNQRGLYQVHVPNEALLAGADACRISLQASGVIDVCEQILLIDANLQNATNLGLSQLGTVYTQSLLITSGSVIVWSPFLANGQLSFARGEEGAPLQFTGDESLPDCTGGSCVLQATLANDTEWSAIVAELGGSVTAAREFAVTLTAAFTSRFPDSTRGYKYRLMATTADGAQIRRVAKGSIAIG